MSDTTLPITDLDRMRADRAENDTKRREVAAFIESLEFETISGDEQARLRRQHSLMLDQVDVLDQRIAAYEPPRPPLDPNAVGLTRGDGSRALAKLDAASNGLPPA